MSLLKRKTILSEQSDNTISNNQNKIGAGDYPADFCFFKIEKSSKKHTVFIVIFINILKL